MVLKQYNYDEISEIYDDLELGGGSGPIVIDVLDKLFKKYKVKTVLDMTCGTGAQTVELAKLGYKITGSDINKPMLDIAKRKSKGLNIKYYFGDIRDSKYGKFDAIISMFNAIGHLSEKDFEKAINNISKNLKEKGLYVFDIFNLVYMNENFINYKFIDRAFELKDEKFVRFNKNKINFDKGILRINQEIYKQKGFEKPEIKKESWDMQIYSKERIEKMLLKNGFKVLSFLDLKGSKLNEKENLSILTVAKKTS